jgi:hypothetical protein
MNDYLNSASSRYKENKDIKINPISKFDAEIIWELRSVIEKLGANEIVLVLDSYKYLKDEDILSLFKDWNKNNPEGVESSKEEGDPLEVVDFRRKFIDFESGMLELYFIKSADKDDYYNFKTFEMEYRIVLNKGFDEKVMFANKTFSFKTPELRDEKLKVLKNNISKEIDII